MLELATIAAGLRFQKALKLILVTKFTILLGDFSIYES